MNDEVAKIRALLKLPEHLDNPEFLSQTIIRLSALNIEVGTQAAQARFKQDQEAVNLLSLALGEGEKKYSVAEAEKRSIVATENEYELLDNLRDDIGELVNSIKKRLDVLSWGFRNG